MKPGDVLWDIGANVGLYSIYAAKKHGIKVFSFEPSIFNLELLGRNCAVNSVSSLITILPFALSDSTKLSCMRHTTLSWGGALSTFGTEWTWWLALQKPNRVLNPRLFCRRLERTKMDDLSYAYKNRC